MASVIGGALVGKGCEMVLEMAVRKLAEEANMVVQFREEFRWLNRKLTYVRGFLKDADQQSRQSEDVREWLEEIRGISLLAEDIVEECAVDSLYGNNSAQSCGLSCNQWIYRYRMGRRIKGTKDRIRSVIEQGSELKLMHQVSSPANGASASTSSERVDWKRSSLLPSGSDSHTVGIDSKVDDLLRLMEESHGSPVIAVVGMGGMGKTHLLQHVFNHSNIKERYEYSIWLSVSQSYSVLQLQKNLVFQLDKDLHEQIKGSEVSEEVLAPQIHERLQGKRCLVVLDDVWRADREDDLLARLGLPITNNSPWKIVVTTRSKEVCANLNAQTYEMQYLSDEDNWRLFCVYAFEGSQLEPGNRLEEVGRMIVKQCGNLPLAIKTIAASLAKTRMPSDWEFKLQQLQGLQGTANYIDPIMPILRLSYDSLSPILKACFAYISFFPEDEEIECEYLIYLWIGEGFIPAGEGQLDLAWGCLHQLANLCLLQLWEEQTGYSSDTLTKYCRVHDLLLDLAIQVSRENRSVFSVEEASKDANADCCRILLGKKDINDNNISETRPVCLRTLSLSQNRGITTIPSNFFTAMRGLRVLDLSGTEISELPESIGKMKLLKVLNLMYTEIREVPECVRHLKSLLFLALPMPECARLPEWINEVKCLEHLECQGVSDRIPKGISELASLKTLRTHWLDLSVEEDKFLKSEDLTKMSQLQELWLNVNHEMELERIRTWPGTMRRLFMWNRSTSELLELSKKMAEMRDLETLYLWNFAAPIWICGFANLRELVLCECDCSNYPELQTMPNLVRLELTGNKRCRELPRAFGNAGGFPQLRFLAIYDFTELEEFPKVEDGAMECLEKFRLIRCPKVKKVGEGLEQLKRLQLVDFRHTGTTEITDKFEESGEYWHRLRCNIFAPAGCLVHHL